MAAKMQITENMKRAAEALARIGGEADGSKWQRPYQLRDFTDPTFEGMGKRGLVALTHHRPERRTYWDKKPYITHITLTAKGWKIAGEQWAKASYDLLRKQRVLAARLALAGWIAEGGEDEEAGFDPEAIFRQRFDISEDWTVKLTAAHQDPTRFYMALSAENLVIDRSGLRLDYSTHSKHARWMEKDWNHTPTLEDAEMLARLLTDGVRLAQALAAVKDENDFISL